MREAQPTPGPWIVASGSVYKAVPTDSDGWPKVCVAHMARSDVPETIPVERDANAHLIAAAPELLAAAEALVAAVEAMPKDYELDTKEHGLAVSLNTRAGDLLRAAISKAHQ